MSSNTNLIRNTVHACVAACLASILMGWLDGNWERWATATWHAWMGILMIRLLDRWNN